MTKRVPAEFFPPGDYIREEMEARGWLQQDLADVLGRPLPAVNELLTGKRAVTPETAQVLEQAFGIDAETWLRLEAIFQSSKLRPLLDDKIALRGKLREKIPLREVVRRGWIESSDDEQILTRNILDFLEIEEIEDVPRWAHAARKSSSYSAVAPEELAWVARARRLARGIQVARKFDPACREELLADLRKLSVNPEDVRHIPRLLAEYGVRAVVIEKLSKTRIDGACFWLDDESPVIALSLRFDRLDYFWFTFLHELAHVFQGIDAKEIIIEPDLVGDRRQKFEDKPDTERIADEFAASVIVDQERLEDYILRVSPLYSPMSIRGFSHLLKVHPGIVVGQLQFREEILWSQHRGFLVKIRDFLIPAALTDGWGFEPPVLAVGGQR